MFIKILKVKVEFRRISDVMGTAVFARVFIPAHSILGKYPGRRYRKGTFPKGSDTTYCIRAENGDIIDAAMYKNKFGNKRFVHMVNHLCYTYNCRFECIGDDVYLVATRDIQIGEEIAGTYGTGYFAKCLCRFVPCICTTRTCKCVHCADGACQRRRDAARVAREIRESQQIALEEQKRHIALNGAHITHCEMLKRRRNVTQKLAQGRIEKRTTRAQSARLAVIPARKPAPEPAPQPVPEPAPQPVPRRRSVAKAPRSRGVTKDTKPTALCMKRDIVTTKLAKARALAAGRPRTRSMVWV
jgi:hypothetical protein